MKKYYNTPITDILAILGKTPLAFPDQSNAPEPQSAPIRVPAQKLYI